MEYLQHHGIPNQKWGERNGPPYPLSREEHIKVVRSGNVEKLKENITEFSDWEIEETLKRYDYNQKINDITNSKEVQKGEKLVKTYNKFMDTAGSVLSKTVYAAEQGIRLYNAVAKTKNALQGKNMKIIGVDNSKKDEHKK